MLTEADQEEAYIDPESVRGYKLTVLCEGVRDELRFNLGEDAQACRDVLRGMLDRRLVPTPWLNQVWTSPPLLPAAWHLLRACQVRPEPPRPAREGSFCQEAPHIHLKKGLHKAAMCFVVLLAQNFREPLYLKDRPVRVEDTRSEEERKYPELFRSKLEGACSKHLLLVLKPQC